MECGARDVTDDDPVTDEDDTHSDKIPACPVQYSFYYCVYLTHSGRDKYWIFCPFVNQRLSLLKDKEIIENISLNTENWIISDCWFLVAQIFLFKLLSGNAQCFTKSSVWWQYARHLLFLPGNIGLTFFADFLLAAEEIHLHDFHSWLLLVRITEIGQPTYKVLLLHRLNHQREVSWGGKNEEKIFQEYNQISSLIQNGLWPFLRLFSQLADLTKVNCIEGCKLISSLHISTIYLQINLQAKF